MKPFFLTFFALLFVGFTPGCGANKSQQGNKARENTLESHSTSCEGFVQNSQGKKISLKNPVTFVISSQVPETFTAAVKGAMDIWNAVLGRPVFTVSGRGENANEGGGSLHWMETWPEDSASQQGETSLSLEDDVIVGADIKINARDFIYSTTLEKATIDFESLLVHELGHVLGLKHDPSPKSVMFLSLPAEVRRLDLSADDLAHVKCAYP